MVTAGVSPCRWVVPVAVVMLAGATLTACRAGDPGDLEACPDPLAQLTAAEPDEDLAEALLGLSRNANLERSDGVEGDEPGSEADDPRRCFTALMSDDRTREVVLKAAASSVGDLSEGFATALSAEVLRGTVDPFDAPRNPLFRLRWRGWDVGGLYGMLAEGLLAGGEGTRDVRQDFLDDVDRTFEGAMIEALYNDPLVRAAFRFTPPPETDVDGTPINPPFTDANGRVSAPGPTDEERYAYFLGWAENSPEDADHSLWSVAENVIRDIGLSDVMMLHVKVALRARGVTF